jgi:hypothetical protein
VEGYEEKKESVPSTPQPPVTAYLKHYLDVHDDTLEAYKNSGSSDLPFTRVGKSLNGPASNECGVFEEFVMFCTVSGTHAEGNVIDIRGIDSGDKLVSVGMDFVTTDGIGYVRGNVGDADVLVKRPDGVDTLSYVLVRSGKELTLKVVSPLRDDTAKDTKPCEVDIRALVNKEMTLNRDGGSFGKFINFGIYQALFSPEQHVELDTFLKKICLLKSPIVMNMNNTMLEAKKKLEDAKTKNPFGSDKITEKCSSSVRDWTNPDYSMAADECKREIASHCTIHPESDGCECWDKKSPKYDSNACKSYRNLFSGRGAIDLLNLDAESLATIKSQYNLFETQPVQPAAETNDSIPQSREWYDYILGTKR